MKERRGVRLRPTVMKRSLLPWALVAVLLAGVAGCGDEDDTNAEPAEDSITVCEASVPAVIRADLDGDGTKEPVEFSAPSGECPAFVKVGDQTANLDIDRPITARELSTVRIPGRTGDLVLYRFEHPRGGLEARLFAELDGVPVEVTREGGPLVPFVATDAATAYTSVTCGTSGFTVTSAVADQPVGGMAAWDVTSTEYVGETLAEGPSKELRDNVPEEQLASSFPRLVRNGLFENC